MDDPQPAIDVADLASRILAVHTASMAGRRPQWLKPFSACSSGDEIGHILEEYPPLQLLALMVRPCT